MDDVDKSKRTLSTPHSSSIKRAKSEHDDYTPTPLPLTAPHGVERIPLPPFVNVHHLSSHHLQQLANERTEILRRQDRQVVGLPLVLNDGIVLNWVRRTPASVSSKVDRVPSVIRHSAARSAHGRTNPRVPIVSAGPDPDATDAIVIDSDVDMSGVSSLRTNAPRGQLINQANSRNQDVIDNLDSDIELLSPVRSKNNVVGDDSESEASCHSPLPALRKLSSSDFSDVLSEPPPRRVSAREEGALAPTRQCSSSTDLTTSDSEAEEMNGAENIASSEISVGHAKPSLQPIRQLLAGRKQQGDPARDVLPRGGIIVSPQVSQKRRRIEFLEETPAITSSESDEELKCRTSDPQLKRVPLPKTVHGRARRLLIPQSADLPLVAVTMRGDCHFIERKKKFRMTGYSLPNPGIYRHVEDVCMVGNTAVLGCDGGTHQISFLSVAGKPRMIDVACSPHSSGPRYQDTQRRGVNRLAAIHAENGHIKFLSGGYDGTIHKWIADVETPDEARTRKVVSHGARIMALAYRDRSVLAAARGRLHTTELSRCITVTHPFSDVIQQIHAHPQATYITLLEVRHLDRQIQLYDSRKGNFDGEPCLSFGRRNTSGTFSGSHTRGSVHLVHFARASEDGDVLLWDFRNGKRAVVERHFQQAEKVVHTVFADRDIVSFALEAVTFFEDYLA